jgi:hypothetical protein
VPKKKRPLPGFAEIPEPESGVSVVIQAIETNLHNYAKHDILTCPLCGESHLCMCNRATECPCTAVNLSRDEADWISWQTGNECVCIPCLLRLREEARAALKPQTS